MTTINTGREVVVERLSNCQLIKILIFIKQTVPEFVNRILILMIFIIE